MIILINLDANFLGQIIFDVICMRYYIGHGRRSLFVNYTVWILHIDAWADPICKVRIVLKMFWNASFSFRVDFGIIDQLHVFSLGFQIFKLKVWWLNAFLCLVFVGVIQKSQSLAVQLNLVHTRRGIWSSCFSWKTEELFEGDGSILVFIEVFKDAFAILFLQVDLQL